MEKLYVIATRGKNNKEIYLKCGNKSMEWTEDIEESYADFNFGELEDYAKNYFKNFKKWYIKEWLVKII